MSAARIGEVDYRLRRSTHKNIVQWLPPFPDTSGWQTLSAESVAKLRAEEFDFDAWLSYAGVPNTLLGRIYKLVDAGLDMEIDQCCVSDWRSILLSVHAALYLEPRP